MRAKTCFSGLQRSFFYIPQLGPTFISRTKFFCYLISIDKKRYKLSDSVHKSMPWGHQKRFSREYWRSVQFVKQPISKENGNSFCSGSGLAYRKEHTQLLWISEMESNGYSRFNIRLRAFYAEFPRIIRLWGVLIITVVLSALGISRRFPRATF